MTARKPLVIVTRKLPAPIEARMGELFDVRLNEDDHPFSAAELAAAIREAEEEARKLAEEEANRARQARLRAQAAANRASSSSAGRG